MKQRDRVSKSIYRAILFVQKDRDKPSGLYISDRYFQPEQNSRNRSLLWLLADSLLLLCLVLGLQIMMVSGFSVPVAGWYYPAIVLACILAACVFRFSIFSHFKILTAAGLLVGFLLALFLLQNSFLPGLGQLWDLIVYTLQKTYSADIPATIPYVDGNAPLALYLLSVPGIFWLAFSLLGSGVFLLANLLTFPLIALVVLCGAAKNTPAMFLTLFGLVLSMAFAHPKKQRRMWGGKNKALFAENKKRFESVQKKTIAFVLAACVCLSVPGFFVVRPLLSVRLRPVEDMSMAVQSAFLNRMLKLLPELSAGQWNLNLEAVGGGVQQGALNSSDGYLLEGVEDLRLTLDFKPREPLFLKGFVGKNYHLGSWEEGQGTTFDGAAINWNTEGSPRIYLQNLPFLRMAYAMSAGNLAETDVDISAITPGQLWVERINANDSYTYVPYGVFLNDYYQVEAGDCAVAGQKEQQDRYLFFTRSDMETLLPAWNAVEGTANVLDRIEESYRAFCQNDCMSLPDGMEELQSLIRDVMVSNKWKSQENINEITSWIRQYMAENYSYSIMPPQPGEGEDALRFFLFDSKAGNSIQFASAAVVLYRMFGVPARYVVGYEIPASLFTAQANGIYTATVQGDNAQAWAEIYVSGLGWSPKDMTPGVIGTYEEIGPGGERIEAVIEDETSNPQETQENTPTAPAPTPETEIPEAETHTHSVREIITFFLIVLLSLASAAALWMILKTLSADWGWNLLGRRNKQARLLGVFQAFCRRMRHLGLPINADSQTEEFAAFCEQMLQKRNKTAAEQLRPAMQSLYLCIYGDGIVREGDIHRMRTLLKAAWKRPIKSKA